MAVRIRLLIADDHPIVREGLRTLLSEEADIEVVGECSSGEQAVTDAGRLEPDVVLMDLRMPGLGGLGALKRIRMLRPRTQVVVLTSFAEDKDVQEAISAGAVGYLLKDALRDDLLRAVRNASMGRPSLHPEAQRHLMKRVSDDRKAPLHDDLTARERDVLKLIGKGFNNQDIATTLSLSEGTIKGYVSAVLTKLAVDDRTQAALYAVKHGLVALDELD